MPMLEPRRWVALNHTMKSRKYRTVGGLHPEHNAAPDPAFSLGLLVSEYL